MTRRAALRKIYAINFCAPIMMTLGTFLCVREAELGIHYRLRTQSNNNNQELLKGKRGSIIS